VKPLQLFAKGHYMLPTSDPDAARSLQSVSRNMANLWNVLSAELSCQLSPLAIA